MTLKLSLLVLDAIGMHVGEPKPAGACVQPTPPDAIIASGRPPRRDFALPPGDVLVKPVRSGCR
jgi:hypothetical protein